jgi:cysteinyl-tRNA synthetase
MSNKTKLYLVNDFDKVLSLNLLEEKEIDNDLKEYIESKIEERKNAKANKDFELADKIREELLNKGIIIKDTREGTTYEIK